MVILAIVTLATGVAVYHGYFEPRVEILSYEVGSFDGESTFPNDYALFVRFTSSGAFIAGRRIDIVADLRLTKPIDSLGIQDLWIVLPGSSPYPVPEGMAEIADAHLQFDSIEPNTAHGEMAVVYHTPELISKNALIPFETHGKHTYNLMIDMSPQSPKRFQRTNPFLYLAPLETKLQLLNNKLMMILALIALFLAVSQVYLALRSSQGPDD
jgi:hypothetical protein